MAQKVTVALLQTLGVSFNALFQGGLGQVESQWQSLATLVPSSTGSNEYGWLGKFPKMREWFGDRVVHGMEAHGYAIKNRDFELTIGVDRNDIEDDNLGLYSPLFTEMGMSAASHPDELVWELWQEAFDTECYDGQNFFDTDHPVKAADGSQTSVSNMQAGAGPAWYLIDDTRALKPVIFQRRKSANFVAKDALTDDNVFNRKEFNYGIDCRDNVGFGFWQFAYGSKATLDGDNYGAARAAMRNMKGDYGRKLGIRPKTLVVPPSLEKKGLQLINATNDAAGASNVWSGTAKLMVADWLDG
ncbi:Mu-like prophage major head subunit gpT family protein [Novosphingobium clariflavum]|uniref:Mu-like prophage major head subunit gpT family protein n=1 Tax=Novosphingobium clariflavum TaxID=2029884 RepID=A0ABV6SAX9_9SPHN|nr:Mu-like prophage major head subunit gpT family protein [Novosphingobium clariflavum]